MCSYGHIVDFVRVSNLDLDALAEGRKHLCEDDLLVPNRLVAALLNRGLSLQMQNPKHVAQLSIQEWTIATNLNNFLNSVYST